MRREKEASLMADLYRIVRMYYDEGKVAHVTRRRLTLEEAQAHCRRSDTRDQEHTPPEWFDGYEEEK